ncbi:ferric reductase-like transmembrane domain-containing protein [Miltoncostaea marina]|uniref:ferric reductase-like transmembrane domain-containing protein n=1 Tax=Miltoncostaea marina TaxID=2843215 RepID=UPI001C3C5B8F|nr:ferric reductase-like transmembrane domain-containing protein [Miltoncostaea marina]
MTAEMLPWVIARSTGLVAFALLTGAVLAGLLVRTRTPAGSLKGSGMVDLHRLLSLLALLLTAAHGVALVLDTTVEIEPLALVVPGLVPYRPVWSAIGVVAAEVALLVHVSFRFRKRIGVPAWRRIHFLAYAAFAGAAVHGIAAGTDTGRPWAMALYGGAVGAVAGLTGWRIVTARRARPGAARQTRRTAGEREATA